MALFVFNASKDEQVSELSRNNSSWNSSPLGTPFYGIYSLPPLSLSSRGSSVPLLVVESENVGLKVNIQKT